MAGMKNTVGSMALMAVLATPIVCLAVWLATGRQGGTTVATAGKTGAVSLAEIRPPGIGDVVRFPESARWLDPKNTGVLKPGQWTVVDIVGLWCPYCPASAAGLVDLERKHRNAGVRFITFASTDEPGMREYTQKWGVDWPVGHSVTRADLAALGAFNDSARIPGYEAKPSLLLVGPDGRLAWTDNHSRFRHETSSATLHALDEAITKRIGNP